MQGTDGIRAFRPQEFTLGASNGANRDAMRTSDQPAAILAWLSADELLLRLLTTNEPARLVRWNLATGRRSFPLKDGGFRRDSRGEPQPVGEGYGPGTIELLAVSANGRAAVVRAHPRPDFKRRILAAFTTGIAHRPDTTFGNVKADVLDHFSPGFQRADFVEVIQNSPWPA